ncbi:MAG: ATP-dependent zinc metalloprotease FtsH [Spirochaetales bacterium]|nr:ATP-dependent zinc metalloprotease FtsH [Spirochaetales bacterium]
MGMEEKHSNRNQYNRNLLKMFLLAMMLVMLFNVLVVQRLEEQQVRSVDYGTFLSMLEGSELSAVQLEDNEVFFVDNANQIYRTNAIAQDYQLVERLDKAGVKFNKVYQKQSLLETLFVDWIIPFLPLMLFFYLVNKRASRSKGAGGLGFNSMMFGGGKSGAKEYVVKEGEGIKFSDVAGQDEAKESLAEIVDFLKNPQKYTEIGAKMPKGALLVGPPGTGKTLLAKAVAGEAGVPFFSIAGSEFVEMFVGMGASKVRDLFRQAGEKAPCIVFIDEIDTIGKKRDSGSGMGGNDEREQTLNQLLTEMDGFDATKGVVILAATNRPETLDPALLRPGRFDRRVPVELPDLKGREAILNLHARKIKLSAGIDMNVIARMTSGASGAELANIINEAALGAIRNDRNQVIQADLQEAVDTILAGAQKKNAILSETEKQIVAYHEVGHALLAALQSHSAPVQKITIIPRTSGALGFTMQVEEGQKNLMSREEMLAKIATFTAGRAAEEVVFGSITNGASNDIEQATKLARAMVTRYGMSKEFDMIALETVNNAYMGGDASLACSETTAAEVDRIVTDIVKEQHQKAIEILRANRKKLDEISMFLYQKETITGEEFMEILTRKDSLPEPEKN